MYWTALYDVLESYGLEVNVAHAQHTKTLPGRKTDVQECQWLQKLHTFGLLNKAFRPAEEIRVLRSYLRQRENLVVAAAMCVQHMQKALTEMNIQLANVISDISGTTGMAILRDIVRGERDPEKLARHKHARIRASHQEIARSLEGTWREELLFVVGQSLDLYDTYQEKIRPPVVVPCGAQWAVRSSDQAARSVPASRHLPGRSYDHCERSPATHGRSPR